MVDVVDKKTRSRMMSGIRGKDTKPEMTVRKYLYSMGYRYRLHDSRLPGKPDLVLKKFKVVIFVHGCFWHQHEGCRYATSPATRSEFWRAKFAGNRERDDRNIRILQEQGWKTIVFWECATRHNQSKHLAVLVACIRKMDGNKLQIPCVEWSLTAPGGNVS